MYGKDTNPTRFVEKAVAENRVLYWDKKTSQELFSIPGLQLPDNITNLDSNTIIRKVSEKSTENVKKHSLRENATDSEGRTLSPKQIEYFKDTKVVDKKGNLLVVYHGTRNDFTVFDKSKGGESNGIADIGFWFTESKQGAQDWADNSWWGDSKTGKAMPLYLEINNPKVYESTDNNTDALIKEKTDIHRQRAKIANKYLYDVDRANGIKGVAEWDAFYALAEQSGSADYYLDKMKEYDRVELIVEKEKYAKDDVHKGMDGWICDPRKIDGEFLVCFDNADDLPEYPIISVKEEDLKVTREFVEHERI